MEQTLCISLLILFKYWYVFYVLLRMRAADLTRVGKLNPLGFEVWSFNVHSLWVISPQYAPLLHIPFPPHMPDSVFTIFLSQNLYVS
jgi:hypothetical protein